MTQPPFLVLGASGNVGGAVAATLRAAGAAVRVTYRPGSAAPASGAAVPFDVTDSASFSAAIDGCRGVFLMRPPAVSNTKRTLVPFIDAVRARGNVPIVFLSVIGADTNVIVPHHAVERRLQRDPDHWTILRPGFFMQNLGGAYRQDIRQDARLYVPAGAGRVTFVDTDDVAAVAAAALLDPTAHTRQAYTLMGPEALSFADAARILTAALGRTIRYEPATVAGYWQHLRARRMPRMQVLVQTLLHVGLRSGEGQLSDATFQRVLARSPGRLVDYVARHVALWQ